MPTTRERLHELLDTLTDAQVETVLGFTEAVRKGHAVVSACDPAGASAVPDDQRNVAQAIIATLADPVMRAFLEAPEDDEPTTEGDLAAITEGNANANRGEAVPLADVRTQ